MPFWSVQIRSPLPVTAVQSRLRGLVESPQERGFWDALEGGLGPFAKKTPFNGEVSGRTFRMVRVTRFRRSVRPVIRGVLTEQPGGGTTIRLRITMPIDAAFLLIVWLGTLAWQSLRDLKNGEVLVGLPLAMMLFGVLLSSIAFFPEAWRGESMIRDAVTSNEQTSSAGAPGADE
jgi:hypothetical protein